MNFTTAEFLLFFPLVLLLHRLLPPRRRWAALLIASYLFYAWWNPWTVFLLAGSTLVSYWAARRIGAAGSLGKKRLWLAAAAASCLGCLFVFKYAGFFLETGAALLGRADSPAPALLLPVGISFYTFQTLSYVIDVYRGDFPPEKHLGYYALFVSFFPQLVAGPIERPGALLPQLKAAPTPSQDDVRAGLRLMLRGFFKKLAIADGLAPCAQALYAAPEAANGPAVVLGTVCFAFQIYCDFSGYSDIAQGTARMLGIRLTDNFRRPYLAGSLRDFWRRWHISLTGWFTDYLYKPLGGSRRGLARQCANLLLVFLASGLWHGAAWTFVVWGGFHGLYLAAETAYRRLRPRPLAPPGRVRTAVRRLGVFGAVCFGWIFFRAASLRDAGLLISRLLCWPEGGWTAALELLGLGAEELARTALLLACLGLLDRPAPLPAEETLQTAAGAALTGFYLALAAGLAWLVLLAANRESTFLYFQF